MILNSCLITWTASNRSLHVKLRNSEESHSRKCTINPLLVIRMIIFGIICHFVCCYGSCCCCSYIALCRCIGNNECTAVLIRSMPTACHTLFANCMVAIFVPIKCIWLLIRLIGCLFCFAYVCCLAKKCDTMMPGLNNRQKTNVR